MQKIFWFLFYSLFIQCNIIEEIKKSLDQDTKTQIYLQKAISDPSQGSVYSLLISRDETLFDAVISQHSYQIQKFIPNSIVRMISSREIEPLKRLLSVDHLIDFSNSISDPTTHLMTIHQMIDVFPAVFKFNSLDTKSKTVDPAIQLLFSQWIQHHWVDMEKSMEESILHPILYGEYLWALQSNMDIQYIQNLLSRQNYKKIINSEYLRWAIILDRMDVTQLLLEDYRNQVLLRAVDLFINQLTSILLDKMNYFSLLPNGHLETRPLIDALVSLNEHKLQLNAQVIQVLEILDAKFLFYFLIETARLHLMDVFKALHDNAVIRAKIRHEFPDFYLRIFLQASKNGNVQVLEYMEPFYADKKIKKFVLEKLLSLDKIHEFQALSERWEYPLPLKESLKVSVLAPTLTSFSTLIQSSRSSIQPAILQNIFIEGAKTGRFRFVQHMMASAKTLPVFRLWTDKWVKKSINLGILASIENRQYHVTQLLLNEPMVEFSKEFICDALIKLMEMDDGYILLPILLNPNRLKFIDPETLFKVLLETLSEQNAVHLLKMISIREMLPSFMVMECAKRFADMEWEYALELFLTKEMFATYSLHAQNMFPLVIKMPEEFIRKQLEWISTSYLGIVRIRMGIRELLLRGKVAMARDIYIPWYSKLTISARESIINLVALYKFWDEFYDSRKLFHLEVIQLLKFGPVDYAIPLLKTRRLRHFINQELVNEIFLEMNPSNYKKILEIFSQDVELKRFIGPDMMSKAWSKISKSDDMTFINEFLSSSIVKSNIRNNEITKYLKDLDEIRRPLKRIRL